VRKTAKALFLVIVSLLSAIVLGAASAFTAALAFGAVALIVPGTGTPNANIVTNYMENVRDRYLTTTACGADGSGCPDADLHGIDYPASFWPLAIFPSWCRSGPNGCDKWDDSVGQGAEALTASLDDALAVPGQQVIVFGYSQGGAVVSKVLHDYGLTEEEKARIEVVTIGGIENPDGGLWQRLAFLQYIPILGVTFAPPMPVDPALKTTTIGFQYDPVVYAPRYWGNPFAMLNALAAFDNVHGYYLAPNGNDEQATLPYGYTPETLAPQLDCSANPGNCRTDSAGNTYIMIPATSLPIMNLIMSSTPAALTPFVKPLVDLISPAYKVLADLGYDWSGPAGVPTPLSILPFNPSQNWAKVGQDLVGAIGQGVQAALGDLGGGSTMLDPATSGPVSPMSTLARSGSQTVDPQEESENRATVTELSSAKKSNKSTGTDVVDVVDAAPLNDDATTTTPATTDSTANPTPPASGDVSATKPVETKPVETKPVETKPVETKPVETKPVETKPVETKPSDPAAEQTKKDETKKDETKKDAADATKKDADDPAKKAA
jgi:pimeloyl-ACP methyl ester carboxylesterase